MMHSGSDQMVENSLHRVVSQMIEGMEPQLIDVVGSGYNWFKNIVINLYG